MKKLVHRVNVFSEEDFDKIFEKRLLELKGHRPFDIYDIIELSFVSNESSSYGTLTVKDVYYDKVNDLTLIKFKNDFLKQKKQKSFFRKIIDFFLKLTWH